MPHSEPLIQRLNQVLNLKLIAIDQFYLHGRLYKKWGLSALAKLTSEKSKEMMPQLDQLISHIQQLGGSADTHTPDNMLTGTTIHLCLELDTSIATQCLQTYFVALSSCDTESNLETIDLMNQFIRQIEGHNNWLNSELDFIQSHGIEAFIKNEMGINQYWKLAAS